MNVLMQSRSSVATLNTDYCNIQVCSQKFEMGGLFRGSGSEAPSCRRLGVWGQSPQPLEARESGGGAPSARKSCIILQK